MFLCWYRSSSPRCHQINMLWGLTHLNWENWGALLLCHQVTAASLSTMWAIFISGDQKWNCGINLMPTQLKSATFDAVMLLPILLCFVSEESLHTQQNISWMNESCLWTRLHLLSLEVGAATEPWKNVFYSSSILQETSSEPCSPNLDWPMTSISTTTSSKDK